MEKELNITHLIKLVEQLENRADEMSVKDLVSVLKLLANIIKNSEVKENA